MSACDGTAPEANGTRSALTALFEDHFSRNVGIDEGLSADWTLVRGLWFEHGIAETDSGSGNLATMNRVSCRDCRVEARVLGFGSSETGVFLRAPSLSSTDRYDAVLTGSGSVQIRRVRGGVVTVLGQGPSGLSVLNAAFSTLSLDAVGAGPVSLTARIDGRVVTTAVDSGGAALIGSGYSGLWARSAGVWFDDFLLSDLSSGGAPTDGGLPPDLAAPADLAVPAPDLATPTDLGAGPFFTDTFSDLDTGLGPDWTLVSGTWVEVGGAAQAHSTTGNVAEMNRVSCRDCQVEVGVFPGTLEPEVRVFLRAPSGTPTDRYEAILIGFDVVQIYRVRGGVGTLLVQGSVASPASGTFIPLSLQAADSGDGRVVLVVGVNHQSVAVAIDDSPEALHGPGFAGMSTFYPAWFDNFVLSPPAVGGAEEACTPPITGCPGF